MSQARQIMQQFQGRPTSDGAGVSLTRLIGTRNLDMLDPFLMLDYFASDEPDQYLAGFPEHPHRGFQTVTYMLAGSMRHKDSLGNEGVINQHGVQWMSAGRGVIHAEMPEQKQGLMQGFQLWVNLPARDKMSAPAYQEFPVEQLAEEKLAQGGLVRVVAGTTKQGTQGPVKQLDIDPIYMDISLSQGTIFAQPISPSANAFVYVIEGSVCIANNTVNQGNIAILGPGDEVTLQGLSTTTRILLVAGEPIGEPVAKGGPFVMNTREELMQAFQDFQTGRFL